MSGPQRARRVRSRRRAGQRRARPNGGVAGWPGASSQDRRDASAGRSRRRGPSPPARYVLRMDQPYSRIADTLLDYQYWAPDDPQRNPYDDTGWTFGELFNVRVVRVTDVKVLDAAMEMVKGELTAPGGVSGTRRRSSPSTTTPTRRSPRCATGSRTRRSTSPKSRSRRPARSSTAARSSSANVSAGDLEQGGDRARPEGRRARRGAAVKTHPARAARVALMHTWINTQDEGWWRLALDQAGGAVHLHQHAGRHQRRRPALEVRRHPLPAVGRGAGQTIITGMPMYGNPIPWKTTELTPNLGTIDETDDIRPGMGWQGMANLQKFVREGGAADRRGRHRELRRPVTASRPACRSRRRSG